MNAASGRAARRELGIVVGVALAGIATTLLVAFAPWYETVRAAPGSGTDVVHVDAPPGTGIFAVRGR